MCCLTLPHLICLRSPMAFCSWNGAKLLQKPHVGWIVGEWRHVQIFRSTWSLPDVGFLIGGVVVDGAETKDTCQHSVCLRANWEVEQSSSAMAIFCLQILCVTAHIPQRFCPVFYSKRKGHTMWFCHCLMHRTILHRLRIQVFSKLTLASCTRRSQGLSSPKFRSDWVIQAGRDSRRSKHSTSCSKQGYISWKHNGHQSQCLNYILHRKWRQWLNLSALH